MKSSVLIVSAVAGCALCASAQEFSLSLVPSATAPGLGGSFTMSVYGDADQGTHLLGGAFSLISNSECIAGMSWTPADWSSFNTDGGYAGSGNYNQVVFGQLVIPPIFPPAPGSELGGLIGTYTIQLGQLGTGVIDFQLVAGTPFTLESIDNTTGETFQSTSGTIALGSARITCFPTPGGCSAFAAAGLIAVRRRR
jgi:hypothetical protein